MKKELTVHRHITPQEQGLYLELPFEVPHGVSRIDISYEYTRFEETPKDDDGLQRISRIERNIVDLALVSPGGYVGGSGSDRRHIWVSAVNSSRGYAGTEPVAGTWAIIIGAYKVQPEGVDVTYTIAFEEKKRQLLKGDTHMHTIASDGVLTVPELTAKARQLGLDFLVLTDHNNYAQNSEITGTEEGITLLPGCEWTHYKGHCNMIGVPRPLDNPFCVNTEEEMQARLLQAKERGALVSLNHPFCSYCPWLWDLDATPYAAIEVWNGGVVPEANRRALDWWHKQLLAGCKLPVLGGSDFHRSALMREVGQPTTCVYALSRSPQDIQAALAAGNSYLVQTSAGPELYAEADGKILGETAVGAKQIDVQLKALRGGDEIHIISDVGTEVVVCPGDSSSLSMTIPVESLRFCRFEIYRGPWKSMTGLPVLISNPIYFHEATEMFG